MFAHIIKLHVEDKDRGDARRLFEDVVLPELRKHDGYQGCQLLRDEENEMSWLIAWFGYCVHPKEFFEARYEPVSGLTSIGEHSVCEVTLDDPAPAPSSQ